MKSELRQDLVTGDWILLAPGRTKRPHDFVIKKKKRKIAPIRKCPFEDPRKSGNDAPSLVYEGPHGWDLQILPNKFPAVSVANVFAGRQKHGVYSTLAGFGRHDIIVTRDHYKNFAAIAPEKVGMIFEAFQERYRMLAKENGKHVAYVSIFHNWGASAGASIYHPHSQMISLPIVPPDIAHSVNGSRIYFKRHHKCVHCLIIADEKKDKKRIIFENKCAIAFAPYVSRTPFELRIFPKNHSPYFEDASGKEVACIAAALQASLKMIEARLDYPDYNFFIHTAPIRGKKTYSHYHWHIEIRPQISTPAGFELSTGMEINVVLPEDAARLLTGGK